MSESSKSRRSEGTRERTHKWVRLVGGQVKTRNVLAGRDETVVVGGGGHRMKRSSAKRHRAATEGERARRGRLAVDEGRRA
jgi:hypothetical protein